MPWARSTKIFDRRRRSLLLPPLRVRGQFLKTYLFVENTTSHANILIDFTAERVRVRNFFNAAQTVSDDLDGKLAAVKIADIIQEVNFALHLSGRIFHSKAQNTLEFFSQMIHPHGIHAGIKINFCVQIRRGKPKRRAELVPFDHHAGKFHTATSLAEGRNGCKGGDGFETTIVRNFCKNFIFSTAQTLTTSKKRVGINEESNLPLLKHGRTMLGLGSFVMTQKEWVARLKKLAQESKDLTGELLVAIDELLQNSTFAYYHPSFIACGSGGRALMAGLEEACARKALNDLKRQLRQKKYIELSKECDRIIRLTETGQARCLDTQIKMRKK